MKTPKLRLLVVDDHFFVRMGLAASLNAEPDMRVEAEAVNGAEAVNLYRKHLPDVVLLDGRLPGMSGLDTLIALRREFPQARVLMLSVDEGEEDIFRAMQAGAAGYLPKTTQRGELLQAIRIVAAGKQYLPPALSARLAQRSAAASLTPQELKVLELLTKGLGNREIGRVLGCSESTAKWHVHNIVQKLEVTDRAEATRAAIERGILHV